MTTKRKAAAKVAATTAAKTPPPPPPDAPPAQEPSSAQPPAAAAPDEQPDVVGVDHAEPGADRTLVEVCMVDLGRARALPETPAGQVLKLDEVHFAPGSIEQFADDDGRTMRIVSVGGELHKYPAEPVVQEDEQTTTEGA